MRASSNSLFGSSGTTIQTRKLEDGRYEASTPYVPEVKPVVAERETDAILAIRQRLEAWTAGGCRQ